MPHNTQENTLFHVIGFRPRKEGTCINPKQMVQLSLYRFNSVPVFEETWRGFQKQNICVWWVGVWEGFYFWMEKNPQRAKKTLMDKMLCTYGVENCTCLSQNAASGDHSGFASQVPDPQTAALLHVFGPGPPLQPAMGEDQIQWGRNF